MLASIWGNLWEEVFWGTSARVGLALTRAHKQMRLATPESVVSYFSLTLPPSSGHHLLLLSGIFSSAEYLLSPVGACLQLHLGPWSPSGGVSWRALKLPCILQGGKEELYLPLVSFSFRGPKPKGFSKTAFLAFTHSPLSPETMGMRGLCQNTSPSNRDHTVAVTWLLTRAALAPSGLKAHFVSGFYLLHMGF